MAKRAKIDENLFAKTDPKSKSAAEDTSPVQTRGLGLRANEWQELEDLAGELGLQSRHAMTAYAVRYFLRQWRDGKIEMQSKPTLPGL